jgi:hypothetical protein
MRQASEWIASQLGMKSREAEAVIRKLIMKNIVTLADDRVSLNKTETTDKLRSILRD